MMVMIDIIDSRCSLRRRNLAVRAERYMVQHAGDSISWGVRDFAGAAEWSAKLDEAESGTRLVFLHASESEPDWDSVVRALTTRMEIAGEGAVRLVSYTGGDAPLESYRMRAGTKAMLVEPGLTAWWRHCSGVRSRRDHRHVPAQAVAVGLDLERPPVERVLEEAMTGLTAAEGPGWPDLDAHAESSIADAASATGGLQHAVVNAVGPLLDALSLAQATGSAVPELEKLWAHLRRRLEKQPNMPSWIEALLLECEQEMLPRVETGVKASLISLSQKLREIAAYAAALERSGPPWPLLQSLAGSAEDRRLRVLWLDDEEAWYDALRPAFTKVGIDPVYISSVRHLPTAEALTSFDAVVVDLILEGQGEATQQLLAQRGIESEQEIGDSNAGLGVIQVIQSLPLPPPVFVLSARESPTVVRACTVLGARDYFIKGRGDEVRLLVRLRQEAEGAQKERANVLRPLNPRLVIADVDDPLGDLIPKLHQIATKNSRGPITFVGAPGVGKTELVRELAMRSSRREAPFITLDCSAFAPDLLESELFGHARGSFTGSTAKRQGLFRSANGGIAFLDEIDKLGLELQGRLLQVIQERKVRAVGEDHSTPVDLLIVVASNADPTAPEGKKLFIDPLVGRIEKFVIRVPTLRERARAVPTIARGICERKNEELQIESSLLPDALIWLQKQAASGRFDESNIRSLENLIERAIVYNDGPELGERELKLAAGSGTASPRASGAGPIAGAARLVADEIEDLAPQKLKAVKDRFEAELLREMIQRVGRKRAAELMGTNETNLRQSIKKLREADLWPWDL